METHNEYYPERVTHPSEILSESLEELEIGAKELAIKTGKPEKTISAVLKGESSITAEMAILFETVLKIPAHFWLEAQRNYDEYKARIKYLAIIEESKEWARSFPYPKMADYGWVKQARKVEEKVVELFNFFGIATLRGFEDYYLNQRSTVAFRLSLKNQKNATAIAAWLRKGEIQAENISAPEFNKSKLRKSLPALKALMAKQPDDFLEELYSICLDAGVKVVHTPCLPKAPIHGSTRWIKNSPLIQLSGRYKRNDIFWFTFFHEVGHILLHGKKYISIENIDIEGEIAEYEKEADEFASEIVLSKKEEEEVLSKRPLSEEDVIDFAVKFGTHPACIVGRLQYLKMIPYSIGNGLIEPIVLAK